MKLLVAPHESSTNGMLVQPAFNWCDPGEPVAWTAFRTKEPCWVGIRTRKGCSFAVVAEHAWSIEDLASNISRSLQRSGIPKLLRFGLIRKVMKLHDPYKRSKGDAQRIAKLCEKLAIGTKVRLNVEAMPELISN